MKRLQTIHRVTTDSLFLYHIKRRIKFYNALTLLIRSDPKLSLRRKYLHLQKSAFIRKLDFQGHLETSKEYESCLKKNRKFLTEISDYYPTNSFRKDVFKKLCNLKRFSIDRLNAKYLRYFRKLENLGLVEESIDMIPYLKKYRQAFTKATNINLLSSFSPLVFFLQKYEFLYPSFAAKKLSLSITLTQVSEIDLMLFHAFTEGLRSLSIIGTKDSRKIDEIISPEHHKNLTSLSLTRFSANRSWDIQQEINVIAKIKDFEKLSRLSLNISSSSEADVEKFFLNFDLPPKLKYLHMSLTIKSQVEKLNLTNFYKAFEKANDVRKFNLSVKFIIYFHPEYVNRISFILSHLKKLERAILNFSPEYIKKFPEENRVFNLGCILNSLSSNKDLRWLYITSSNCKALNTDNPIPSFKNLENLYLVFKKPITAGHELFHLLEIFGDKLRELNIDFQWHISSKKFIEILAKLRKLKNLESIKARIFLTDFDKQVFEEFALTLAQLNYIKVFIFSLGIHLKYHPQNFQRIERILAAKKYLDRPSFSPLYF